MHRLSSMSRIKAHKGLRKETYEMGKRVRGKEVLRQKVDSNNR